MLRTVFVQMAGNSVVDVPRYTADATQAGTSCTFDGFRDDGDRGNSGFVLLKMRAMGMTVEICWERKLVTGRLVKKKNDHTARSCE